jgi:hypothetical protein
MLSAEFWNYNNEKDGKFPTTNMLDAPRREDRAHSPGRSLVDLSIPPGLLSQNLLWQ